MNEVALNGFSSREMDLVRRTVAKDCNDPEFDVFMHICKHTGLDPLRRQIYAFVFNKGKPDRQMVPVTAIGGFRSIAERTGNYRPDNRVPRIEYSKDAIDENTNPLGIIRAEVSVFKYAHGDWHEAVAEAWWDEYVPIWNGEIDKRKTGWIKMPRIMLPKCAEAGALRKAWPDDFAMLYEESELDRAQSLDLSPSELAELGGQEKRLEKLGGSQAIMIDWLDGKTIERVPVNDAAERIDRFIAENNEEPNTLMVFRDRNQHALREFWAMRKGDALELNKRFEQVIEGPTA